MNKNTIQLPGDQGEWGSYISKYQPDSSKVLDNMFTSGSKNFITDQTGMIDKRQGGIIWNRTSFGNVAKDSYEAIFESGSRHFLRVGGGILSASTGTGLFNNITTGYSVLGFFEWATYQDRVYGCNGINAPQVYDVVTSYGGVSYSFTTGKTKTMGAQAPLTAPTAGSPTAGGSVPVGPHRYQVTYLYYGSEESNGSASSATQTTTGGTQTIPLTNIPIGGYGVTARRIYRDNNDGVFLLLTQISDNTTTTYTDTLLLGATPTAIPRFNDTPPTFSKIALWLDSLWISPTGESNLLRYSNSGSPDIYDPDNFVRCQSDDVITAITVYNGKLYVHGLHSFGSIEGTTPDTFYYNNISNNIGCTDNRSIQIRSIVSVPTLWWLSDKGLYYSNGYTVEYGSDFIQDLVNLNLAQVNYSTNKNTQSSQADFEGDTSSPGIDLDSQPGAITTINPEAAYSNTSDWEGGSVTTNIRTKNANLIEVPTQDVPALDSGSYVNTLNVSNTVQMPVAANFTGEDHSNDDGSEDIQTTGATWYAQPIVAPRAGTLTSVSVRVPGVAGGASGVFQLKVWNAGSPTPGSVAFTGSPIANPAGVDGVFTASVSIPVTAGQVMWIGLQQSAFAPSPSICTTISSASFLFNNSSRQFLFSNNSGGNWQILAGRNSMICGYTYTQTAVAGTGTWTSPAYDSLSLSALTASIAHTGVFPTFTSSITTVQGSPVSDFSSGVISTTVASLNGSSSISLANVRYWRILFTLNTTDDRVTPTLGAPTLKFSINGIWVSQPIHATTDNTGWGALTYTGNVPAGTTVVLTIATSPDNITYSSFTAIGSAVTQPWAKVKLTLTTTADDITTPSLSSVTLTWNLTSQIVSSAIDTGTVPAGFSTVQWEETNLAAGTVTMFVRTASTAPGLSAASYVAVANGSFPNLTPLQFVQWKLILTATADNAPVITSVTINWFVGTGSAGVRCASIFYNKTYYLSVALIGSTANNIIIQLDQFGKWRIQKDNSVGTFLLYFNTLYFTDGISDNIYNGFIADTDNGVAIEMDVRTKAWNENKDMFLKIPRGFKITGLNTGTTIHTYYSTDRGATWIEMVNEAGNLGFTTNTSKTEFVVLFVPNADTLISGRTLIYRIVSNDAFPCSIINYEPSMYTRKARYLSNG